MVAVPQSERSAGVDGTMRRLATLMRGMGLGQARPDRIWTTARGRRAAERSVDEAIQKMGWDAH